jgi:hypothetical protein
LRVLGCNDIYDSVHCRGWIISLPPGLQIWAPLVLCCETPATLG